MAYKGFVFKIQPTEKQKKIFELHFGHTRFIWNHFLALKEEIYQKDKRNIGTYELKRKIPELKQAFPWLKEANSQSLQEKVLDLGKAFQAFFQKLRKKPKFRKKVMIKVSPFLLKSCKNEWFRFNFSRVRRF